MYALCRVQSDIVSYSGPTLIKIRSGKHDSSTAESHAADLRELFLSKRFSTYTHTTAGDVKPIVMWTCDGGPDENPRYPRALAEAVSFFVDFDLDALFIATNAPGLSAFNRVERRMAPLSKALAGVILPHNHFGSHLSSQGETTDLNLEKQNFQKAGEILAEIWSEYSIDGHDVHAQYVPPVAKRGRPAALKVAPEAFVANHCIQSTYCLQIVKCKNSSCCKPWRSNYVMRLPRFLPKPAPLVYKESGPAIDLSQAENPTNEAFFRSPISLQKDWHLLLLIYLTSKFRHMTFLSIGQRQVARTPLFAMQLQCPYRRCAEETR